MLDFCDVLALSTLSHFMVHLSLMTMRLSIGSSIPTIDFSPRPPNTGADSIRQRNNVETILLLSSRASRSLPRKTYRDFLEADSNFDLVQCNDKATRAWIEAMITSLSALPTTSAVKQGQPWPREAQEKRTYRACLLKLRKILRTIDHMSCLICLPAECAVSQSCVSLSASRV